MSCTNENSLKELYKTKICYICITLSNKDDCVQLISTTNHWTSYIVGLSII